MAACLIEKTPGKYDACVEGLWSWTHRGTDILKLLDQRLAERMLERADDWTAEAVQLAEQELPRWRLSMICADGLRESVTRFRLHRGLP